MYYKNERTHEKLSCSLIIPDIEKRISIARGTMYSLMRAGLHAINGINLLIAWKLWRTFVVPRMLYGTETPKITTDIYKLEQFQKKTLK